MYRRGCVLRRGRMPFGATELCPLLDSFLHSTFVVLVYRLCCCCRVSLRVFAADFRVLRARAHSHPYTHASPHGITRLTCCPCRADLSISVHRSSGCRETCMYRLRAGSGLNGLSCVRVYV
uniref:Uncharacterized protein n=1 Tax=Leishmania guyanensis TaxID=5670 RepID=A0A1E1IR12_LEIGU|nr:Hypothetical protein BN36_1112060 [Leishmania guyanensis]